MGGKPYPGTFTPTSPASGVTLPHLVDKKSMLRIAPYLVHPFPFVTDLWHNSRAALCCHRTVPKYVRNLLKLLSSKSQQTRRLARRDCRPDELKQVVMVERLVIVRTIFEPSVTELEF
jgi:hypothetical protein